MSIIFPYSILPKKNVYEECATDLLAFTKITHSILRSGYHGLLVVVASAKPGDAWQHPNMLTLCLRSDSPLSLKMKTDSLWILDEYIPLIKTGLWSLHNRQLAFTYSVQTNPWRKYKFHEISETTAMEYRIIQYQPFFVQSFNMQLTFLSTDISMMSSSTYLSL